MAEPPLYAWQGKLRETTERDFEAASRAEIERARASERKFKEDVESKMELELERMQKEWKVKKEVKEEQEDLEEQLLQEAKRRVAVAIAKEAKHKEAKGQEIIHLYCNIPPFQLAKEEVEEEGDASRGSDETLGMLCDLEHALSGVWPQPLQSGDLTHLLLD